MKALAGTFNQEKALIGAFSVIVKTDCETDGSVHSTTADTYSPEWRQIETDTGRAGDTMGTPSHTASASRGTAGWLRDRPEYFSRTQLSVTMHLECFRIILSCLLENIWTILFRQEYFIRLRYGIDHLRHYNDTKEHNVPKCRIFGMFQSSCQKVQFCNTSSTMSKMQSSTLQHNTI